MAVRPELAIEGGDGMHFELQRPWAAVRARAAAGSAWSRVPACAAARRGPVHCVPNTRTTQASAAAGKAANRSLACGTRYDVLLMRMALHGAAAWAVLSALAWQVK
jgi:hypothetical protein